VRIGLVVERVDLDVARRPVQGDGFAERFVRLQPDNGRPVRGRAALELVQQATTVPRPPCLVCDSHAFELWSAIRLERQGAAADRPAAKRREEKSAGGVSKLLEPGGDAHRRVEPPGNRRPNSSTYARRQNWATGRAGSTSCISTNTAVTVRLGQRSYETPA
jgi:hypothetical protein